MSDLTNKVALVTGGGTGIGEAIAVDLAAAGAHVIVCGRRLEPLQDTIRQITDKGGSGESLVADLTDEDQVEQLANNVLASHGAVDILINNAGFSSKVRSARYISAEEWRNVMDVNTLGPTVLTRALLEPMIDRKIGHVVMISSMAAIRPGVMAGVVYSAAKVAQKAYMDVLSQEVRQFGVRCTTVYPGEVDTPILDNRPLPPGEAERATMMQSKDISDCVMMALRLPQRANVSEIAVTATYSRDMSADIKAALDKKSG